MRSYLSSLTLFLHILLIIRLSKTLTNFTSEHMKSYNIFINIVHVNAQKMVQKTLNTNITFHVFIKNEVKLKENRENQVETLTIITLSTQK